MRIIYKEQIRLKCFIEVYVHNLKAYSFPLSNLSKVVRTQGLMKMFPLWYKEQDSNQMFDKCIVNCATLMFDWSNSPVFEESIDNITHRKQHACKHFIWTHMCVSGRDNRGGRSAAHRPASRWLQLSRRWWVDVLAGNY